MQRCVPSLAMQWTRDSQLCRSNTRILRLSSYIGSIRRLSSQVQEWSFNDHSTTSNNEPILGKPHASSQKSSASARQDPLRVVRALLAAHRSGRLPSKVTGSILGHAALPANGDHTTSAIAPPDAAEAIASRTKLTERVTPASLLVSCITHNAVNGSLHAVNNLSCSEWEPTEPEKTYLRKSKYKKTDIQKWSRILLATTSATIETELLSEPPPAPESSRFQSVSAPVPHWIVRLYLDQSSINTKMLSNIHQYFRRIVDEKKKLLWPKIDDSQVSKSKNTAVTDEHLILGCIFRLIHHARRTWPEMVVAVSDLAIQILNRLMVVELHLINNQQRTLNLRRLTRYYNNLLIVLSRPSAVAPFHAARFLQKAQFNVLRAVQSHNNLLTINREGYRAIISVQLSTVKTAQERDWSQLKAKSWPPFKQDKTGLDSEKDKEYGTSRAFQAIQQAARAGYQPLEWENAAQVLSGWDVDGSPTIQTRAMLPHLKSGKNVWAARISATRTAHEAWAMFLAYEESGQPAAAPVYMAMLVKLVYAPTGSVADMPRNTRYSSTSSSERRSLEAGDMIEPLPNPESPRDTPYMSRALPSFDHFANTMYEKGLKLSNSAVAFLVAHAESLEDGLKYLSWGTRRAPAIACLFEKEHMTHDRLVAVPITIFSGFIKLLCRFSLSKIHLEHFRSPQTQELSHSELGKQPPAMHDQPKPWELARQLLLTRAPRYKPPWHHFILTCAKLNMRSQGASESKTRLEQASQAAFYTQEAFNQMRRLDLSIDIETFRLGCLTVEKYMISRILHYLSPSGGIHQTKHDATLENDSLQEVSSTKTHQLIDMFTELFGTPLSGAVATTSLHMRANIPSMEDGNATTQIPQLLATPSAASLHAFVRAIGIAARDQCIVDFARWMARYHREILTATEMPRNGVAMLRKVIIAIRVFLERSWMPTSTEAQQRILELHGQPMGPTSNRLSDIAIAIANARESIEEVEDFGGWATDKEVAAYVDAGAFPWNEEPSASRIMVKGSVERRDDLHIRLYKA